MKKVSNIATLATTVFALGSFADKAQAALTLTLNEFTTDTLSFSVSGTFDADAQGQVDSVFAIKADWFTNMGTNTDWMDDAIGFDSSFNAFTVTENTISTSGAPILFPSVAATPDESFGDSIAFYLFDGIDFVSITAGMTLDGTLTISRPGAFSPSSVGTLQLVTGFEPDPDAPLGQLDGNFVGLEAVVPEPSSALLAGFGALALAFGRRKR